MASRRNAVRTRALRAVTELRRGDARSLSEAARRNKTTLRSVRKYVPGTIEQPPGSSRIEARRGDSYCETMTVLSSDGPLIMDVCGSRQRSKVGVHANAIKTFLETGDAAALEQFSGVSVTGTVDDPSSPYDGQEVQADFMTDLDDIEMIAGRGELEDVEVYRFA